MREHAVGQQYAESPLYWTGHKCSWQEGHIDQIGVYRQKLYDRSQDIYSTEMIV